ncbi:glycosyltransferase [Demequina flava]|uniref:glycosyltransferase n=1 Tax=Demequina flava TaxID=1095025 RepID=UPI0009E361D7|nr:glycosyltransferase [Demequina flava]
MKLVVQVPCLNEEATLAVVLESIPTSIEGIDEIELLVIDDGSTDRTGDIAREHGAHVLRHARPMGLAQSFRDGVDYALAHGADIVVNTDGDNQYPQERIGDLVAPILRGDAEIVMGDRQTHKIEHFSAFKKSMQRFGSWVVNKAAGTDLPDAASGFRAYSRYSLYRLNIVTRFSYCMETIIQAGNKRLAIVSIPVDTNPKTRESRLFKNSFEHMLKSAQAIMRSFVMFRPWTIFASLGTVLLVAGLIPFVRFLILRLIGDSGNHYQSLLLGTVLLVGAFLSFALGVLSDLMRTNRTIQEQALEHLKVQHFGPAHPASVAAQSATSARSAPTAPTPTAVPSAPSPARAPAKEHR